VRSIPKLPIYNKRPLGENTIAQLLLFLAVKANKNDGQKPQYSEIGLENAAVP
jgi:hypothetical protein